MMSNIVNLYNKVGYKRSDLKRGDFVTLLGCDKEIISEITSYGTYSIYDFLYNKYRVCKIWECNEAWSSDKKYCRHPCKSKIKIRIYLGDDRYYNGCKCVLGNRNGVELKDE